MAQRVCYLYNEDITKYEFSKEHPMKTKRIKMAHSLIHNYQLTPLLKIYHPKQASSKEMTAFHNPYYLSYLQTWVSPKTKPLVLQYTSEQELMKARADDSRLGDIFKVNQSFDCPGFEGLYDFCRLAAGSSIDAADLVIAGEGDVVINWSGGFHHAKKSQASGFCYINDIVLCILELLKVYPRVLYLDIDVHHGDGVEEAFFHTNRVMTVSFHEFEDDFFPGTGALDEVGDGVGKFFTVNVPLKRGINDMAYLHLFKRVMGTVMAHYVPDVVVIQCGADSLSKDKLGHLNLSIRGHGELLTYMKSFGMPLILLGGGGYTIQNVSRCWTYETGLMLGRQIGNQIPSCDSYYNFYAKEKHRIHFDVERAENQNPPEYCDEIIKTITENLRQSEIRPSICFHSAPRHYVPSQQVEWDRIEEDESSMVDEVCEKYFKKL